MNSNNEYEKPLNPEIIEDSANTNNLNNDLVKYLNEMFVETPSEKDKEMIREI